MAMLGLLPILLFSLASQALSFPNEDVPNVEPEFLDALLQNKEYELFSKLMKIDDVNLVRPGKATTNLDPKVHAELQHGDILMTQEQKEQARQGLRFDRYPSMKWPKVGNHHRMPYVIANQFSDREKEIILSGIRKWNEQVPWLKLYPRANENDYVMIINGQGCYSYLGKIGGQQALSLQSNGCLWQSTILHEIDHAAGFAHEQNRSDRDDWIEILWGNIPQRWHSQYEKTNSRDFGLQDKYDYYSIMHYGMRAPETGKDAFRLPSGVDRNRVGNSPELTRSDLAKLHSLYGQ